MNSKSCIYLVNCLNTGLILQDLFNKYLTPEVAGALAVEHLCLLDLAGGSVLAGVGQARVVAALAHAAAVQHVALVLLQVVQAVVDIQEAHAAHEARGHRRPLLHAGRRDEEEGRRRNVSLNVLFSISKSVAVEERFVMTPTTKTSLTLQHLASRWR